MRQPFIPKGRNLGQTSDLTLFAPIRKGMVGSLDAITYRSRVKRTLEILHGLRSRSHEYAYVRMISDAVERVGAIQSVRVLIAEPQDAVMLSVTFDGNWESYLRVLWHKVGALLDLIFCNTEGYVDAQLNSYEDWAAWVRKVQTETSFFYGSPAITARDTLYHRRQERRRLGNPPDEERDYIETTDVLPAAEQEAGRLSSDPELNPPIAGEMFIATALRQGLRSAAALYRMTEMYKPRSEDGDRLHRAAMELLGEFVTSYRAGVFEVPLNLPAGKLRERFARELAWLFDPPTRGSPGSPTPSWPNDLNNVQGGILNSWEGTTHGALVFLSFASPNCAAAFLRALRPRLATATANHTIPRDTIVQTMALTMDGLHALGADSALVEAMPEAFSQGMAARGGLLGDVRSNHPDRWQLPRSFRGSGRIALQGAHAVVQLRVNAGDDALLTIVDTQDARHPLHAAIKSLDSLASGASVVAVEPMRRLYRNPTSRQGVHEHFGFMDGQGQPQIEQGSPTPDYLGNVLPVGELLVGYPNSGDIGANHAGSSNAPDKWLHDSTFLVVRKYRQYVDRFEAATSGVTNAAGNKVDQEVIAGKLMGRDRQGRPMVDTAITGNAFDYTGDPEGVRCPLAAHIRRGNPREEALTGERPPGSRPARIVRRSLSYGPTVEEAKASGADGERGLVFMAYNASISEQFEVIQRWMTGGNSTGSASFNSCPMLAVPESGRVRHFRFASDDGEILRIPLDGHGPLFDDPEPMVRLEWGAYLWVPSLRAVEQLADLAIDRIGTRQTAWDLQRGRMLLKGLQTQTAGSSKEDAVSAWKNALEDVEAMSSFDSASIWAAIREDHAGVLRTPYGVLVGDHAALHEAFKSSGSRLSVSGYQTRLRLSIGEIYLGLDDTGVGCPYQQQAGPVNAAISALDAPAAFKLALDATTQTIDALVEQAKASSQAAHDLRFETVFEPRELFDEVLARLCESWCGLSEAGGHLSRGPLRWDWESPDPPSYPGHFLAPSRFTFQPNPGPDAVDFGTKHGAALREALGRLVNDWKATGVPGSPLAQAIMSHPLAEKDLDFAARTLAGTVMGFVPTLDGALRALIHEWLRDGTFGALRAQHGASSLDHGGAEAALWASVENALQLRTVPDMIWRTAESTVKIGGVQVDPGDTIVFGLASATQQLLAAGLPDPSRTMFGGKRSATGPTHACPGYNAAQAVLLGVATGLLTTPHPITQVGSTFAFRVEGASGAHAVKSREPAPVIPKSGALEKETVLVWGDSWVNVLFHSVARNLSFQLASAGFNVPWGPNNPFDDIDWLNLKTMGDKARQDPATRKSLEGIIKRFQPRWILLSGGGNDATSAKLRELVHKKGTPGGPLNRANIQSFVHTELGNHYRAVIDLIQSLAVSSAGRVKVVMHGYDYPLPQATGGSSLGPYLCGELGYSEQEAADVMRQLIDELNLMMATIATAYPVGAVIHIDLRGVIASSTSHGAGWINELHPNPVGFKLLAQKMAQFL